MEGTWDEFVQRALPADLPWVARAQEIALDYGYKIDDEQATWVLWEHSAWPLGPARDIVTQLHLFYARQRAMTPREHAIRLLAEFHGE